MKAAATPGTTAAAAAAAADDWFPASAATHTPFPSPPHLPCLLVTTSACLAGTEPSPLWGCHGELWHKGGLLSDWSFAGYGAGLEAIPSPPVTVDVKRDFGAAGNGLHDDTGAVKAAIDATRATGGVIYFPPGK